MTTQLVVIGRLRIADPLIGLRHQLLCGGAGGAGYGASYGGLFGAALSVGGGGGAGAASTAKSKVFAAGDFPGFSLALTTGGKGGGGSATDGWLSCSDARARS